MKKMDPYKKYGATTLNSDHVEDIFAKAGPRTPYEEYVKQQQEAIYDSHKKEPLGVSYCRNHVLPPETSDPNFAFGIPSGSSDDAKGLMYPQVTKDDSEHKAMYIRSHGSYEPAEQRKRHYAWRDTQIKDPDSWRFGKGSGVPERNGVGMCINNQLDNSVPKTRIAHHAVEKLKSTKDQLGRCRNLGNGKNALPEDHTFGVTGGVDEWGASKCIEGDYSVAEQMPDPDLGRATQFGWRNSTVETRSFGVPTVRTDVNAPERRSVADNCNYGNDVSAAFLVAPDQFADRGLDDQAFAEALSRKEIHEIFDNIGYSDLSDDVFSRIWNEAANMNLSRNGEVSVAEFQGSLNEYLDAKEDGYLRSWIEKTSP
jgi:hypothetical protein